MFNERFKRTLKKNFARCAIPAEAKRDPPGVMKITRRVRWEDGIAMLSKHALFTAKQVFLLSVDLKFLLLNSGRDHPPRRGAVAGLTERHLRNLSFRLLFNKLLTRDSTISKDFILYHHVNR